MTVTEREKFLAVVLTAPLNKADAIVVLCGQDGIQRGLVAQQLLLQGAAPTIVLTGSLDADDKQSANTVSDKLIGNGVSPDRIVVDQLAAENTKEQAENVRVLAKEVAWKSILLVASPNHLPRAFLTFVKAFKGMGVRIIPVTANHLNWWGKPESVSSTRLALLDSELAKTQAYQELGDVAHYSEGLKHMEGK